MNTSISLPGFSEFRLNIRALQNFPSALTDPRVDQEINVVYGLRSKCHGIDAPIPGTNVAATISVKVPGGAFSVVSSIATGELWPDGKMDGEREVTKTCHIPTAASGEYAIRFAGEYGLFVALQGFSRLRLLDRHRGRQPARHIEDMAAGERDLAAGPRERDIPFVKP